MKILKYKFFCILVLLTVSIASVRCSKGDFPIDEDGLLITNRTSTFVGDLDLWGANHQTVRAGTSTIDTVAQTVNITVHFGTDLTRLWPRFSLAPDAKLEPKITGYVDFSDLANPKQWTVISGDRQVRKTYTVTVNVQQPQ